jgi:hypothetical protein
MQEHYELRWYEQTSQGEPAHLTYRQTLPTLDKFEAVGAGIRTHQVQYQNEEEDGPLHTGARSLEVVRVGADGVQTLWAWEQ